jgi:undecaprenyl-diphosphatase
VTVTHALLLGIIQGFTEFVPISSSGHLLLAETWMALPAASLQGFDIFLHGGTLVALLLCYPRVWWNIFTSPFSGDRRARYLLFLLLIATVPGAVAGALFGDMIEESLRSPRITGVEFLINAGILLLAERMPQERLQNSMRWVHALMIGIAQAFALSPGLSRSALTVSAARALRFDRRDALDFSFLMAVPIIAGATAFTAADVLRGTVVVPSLAVTIVGVATACVSSVVAILWLRQFVARRSLAWFACYLIPVGLLLCIRV